MRECECENECLTCERERVRVQGVVREEVCQWDSSRMSIGVCFEGGHRKIAFEAALEKTCTMNGGEFE